MRVTQGGWQAGTGNDAQIPCQLREAKKQTAADAEITANYLKYFGEPVYEFTLIQGQEDGYLAACEIVRLKPSIDLKTYTRADVFDAKPVDARTGKDIAEEEIKDQYSADRYDLELILPERITAMCADLFKRLCEHGGPEQKVMTFYQMVGRGTRILEKTQKYKFWLYGYTGVTALFGTDFITKPHKSRQDKPGGGGGDEGDGPPTLPELKNGQTVGVTPQGRFILQQREGRDVPIPLDEYRREMIDRVLREAATIHYFRGLWVEAEKRRKLINHLLGEHYSPDTVRELMDMADCDHFDLFAHFGYREKALKRVEREEAFLEQQILWFASMDDKTAIVVRGIGQQFGVGGTDALESSELWNVPEIRRVGGFDALRTLGNPAEVMREAKVRLFAA